MLFFQMDPKEDILTPLMRVQDPGYRQFVTNCFLLLDPKEIKACRLVCKEWNEFVIGRPLVVQERQEGTKQDILQAGYMKLK